MFWSPQESAVFWLYAGGNTVNVLEFITHLHIEVKKDYGRSWWPSPAARLTFRASLSLETQ